MSEERVPYLAIEPQQGLSRPALGTWLRHKCGIEGPFVGVVSVAGGRPQWCVAARWPDLVTHYAAPPESWEHVPTCSVCGLPLQVCTADDRLGAGLAGGCTCYYWCPQCGEAGDP